MEACKGQVAAAGVVGEMDTGEQPMLGDPAALAAISFSELNLNLGVPEFGCSEDAAPSKASRVRKGYSGRSSNFLPVESTTVGKQKLRGPSGAHLPQDEVVKAIYALDDTKLNKLDKELSDLSLSAPKFGGPKVPSQGQLFQSATLQPQQGYEQPFKPEQPSLSQAAVLEKRGSTPWNDAEDEMLRAAVKRFGEKNWKEVAGMVTGRASNECIQRWKNNLKPGLKKGQWSRQEDALLIEHVQAALARQVRRLNWSEIARFIPKRSSKQCRERWVNHLNPDVNKGEWTAEEDELLWEYQKEMPRKWAHLARKIPGRTENQVKVRWNILNRHRQRYGGGRPEDLRKKLNRPPVAPSSKNTGTSGAGSARGIVEKTKKLAHNANSAPASTMGGSLNDFEAFIGIHEQQHQATLTNFGTERAMHPAQAISTASSMDPYHQHVDPFQHVDHAGTAPHFSFMPPPASVSYDATINRGQSDFADAFAALPSNSSFRHSFKDFHMRDELADPDSIPENLFGDLDA